MKYQLAYQNRSLALAALALRWRQPGIASGSQRKR